jgi:hypothetical protein
MVAELRQCVGSGPRGETILGILFATGYPKREGNSDMVMVICLFEAR